MSREAIFMQGWQQTLIDERGGLDGHNLDNLITATHVAHEGTNPALRAHNESRTVRALVLGSTVFEALCEDALLQSTPGTNPGTYDEVAAAIDPLIVSHLPAAMKPVMAEYITAFGARANDSEPTPSKAGSFSFYQGALSQIHDAYWRERLAYEEAEGNDTDALADFKQALTDGIYSNAVTVLSDGLDAAQDVLVAMSAGLCVAKRRACSAAELSDFIIDNIDVATAVASLTRAHLGGSGRLALPYRYGYEVLRGNKIMLEKPYLTAIKEKRKWQAYWTHPALRDGSLDHPGHCPASDYNQLRPRTEKELSAIRAALAVVELEHLVQGECITSGRLLLPRALEAGQTSILGDSDWQQRLLLHASK
jgi:hypothetical protein